MKLINKHILKWHSQFGRKDLPWHGTQDAYRIWVSEIMLQQTQVKTVIPFYQRFIKQYPDIASLASANLDAVLHLWTGLGYYARARNLHKAAIIVHDKHADIFPSIFTQVLALPGLGRSTAAAILAFSDNQRHAILDGNVKRVLARFYLVDGWYASKATATRLWDLAEQNTPHKEVARYTQAIMDFGATLCTRSKPRCHECPLQKNCGAYTSNRVSEFPQPKPKTDKPTKQTYMLLIRDEQGAYLLQQKPPSGIWGGLWCPPQVNQLNERIEIAGLQVKSARTLPSFKHSFSHFHLLITPVEAQITTKLEKVTEQAAQVWYKSGSNQQLGLAAPVKKMLEQHSKT